jgi:hypothetical protein
MSGPVLVGFVSRSSLSWVNCRLSNSSFLNILRVRFFEMVSIGLNGYCRDDLPVEHDLPLDDTQLRHGLRMHIKSGRRVGRQPLMMPIEGSTELQMNTSLFAQLISFV